MGGTPRSTGMLACGRAASAVVAMLRGSVAAAPSATRGPAASDASATAMAEARLAKQARTNSGAAKTLAGSAMRGSRAKSAAA